MHRDTLIRQKQLPRTIENLKRPRVISFFEVKITNVIAQANEKFHKYLEMNKVSPGVYEITGENEKMKNLKVAAKPERRQYVREDIQLPTYELGSAGASCRGLSNVITNNLDSRLWNIFPWLLNPSRLLRSLKIKCSRNHRK